MKKYICDIEIGRLILAACADNAVRLTLETGAELKRAPVSAPDAETGEIRPGGIKAGELLVKYEQGVLSIEAPKARRRASLKLTGDGNEKRLIFTLSTRGESFYGLGGSAGDSLILRDAAYAPGEKVFVPFVVTKSGYALSAGAGCVFDVRTASSRELRLVLPLDEAEIFIYSGAHLKALLERFAYITGRTPVLPAWCYALMLDERGAEVSKLMDDAAEMRRHGIPCDALIVHSGAAQGGDVSVNNAGCRSQPHSFMSALGRYGFKTVMASRDEAEQKRMQTLTYMGARSLEIGEAVSLSDALRLGLSGVSNAVCGVDIFDPLSIHTQMLGAVSVLDCSQGYCQPWWAGVENERLFTAYDRTRYHLLPYIYSAALSAHITGVPMLRPLALEFDDEEVKDYTGAFMLGESLLVAARGDKVRLPSGECWVDAWTYSIFDGGQELDIYVPEDRSGALFVRNGAVIAAQPGRQYVETGDSEYLTLECFAVFDCDAEHSLFEDDGASEEYLRGRIARTRFRLTRRGKRILIDVGLREGEFEGMNPERRYRLKIITGQRPITALVDSVPVNFEYDNYCVCLDMGTGRHVEIII